MNIALIFLGIFFAVLAAGGILYFFATRLYKFCKWVARKTGNDTIAFAGIPIVLLAAAWAGLMTWIIAANAKH